MAVLLVTYDLNKSGQNYEGFYKVIKQFSWAKLSESSYAILTDYSPSQIYEDLRKYMDSNDFLYVINLTRPYVGYGPKDVNEWLEKNLPWR